MQEVPDAIPNEPGSPETEAGSGILHRHPGIWRRNADGRIPEAWGVPESDLVNYGWKRIGRTIYFRALKCECSVAAPFIDRERTIRELEPDSEDHEIMNTLRIQCPVCSERRYGICEWNESVLSGLRARNREMTDMLRINVSLDEMNVAMSRMNAVTNERIEEYVRNNMVTLSLEVVMRRTRRRGPF